jgi:TrmH family RNA methyltransferase
MLSKSDTKYIQSLHLKKFRDVEHNFIAEGSKVVLDLLQCKHLACQHIIGLQEWLHTNEPFVRKYYSGPLQEVLPLELEKISALHTPNQVLAVFEKAAPAPLKLAGNISLVLDDVQDPGNMGTIIRIADWFGVKNIVCSLHSADIYNPKVVQSTMGSLGRVNIIYANLSEWLAQNNGISVYAAALDGKNLAQVKTLQEAILIIGNESKGISEAILQLATEKITIPRIGAAESLNAAVATGIILSHLVAAR